MIEKPQVGQMVLIRRRPAIIREIETTKGINSYEKDHDLHLVSVEYLDNWDYPGEDNLIWERERGAHILSKIDFPKVESSMSDNTRNFNAFRNGIKWGSLGQYFNFNKQTTESSLPVYTRLFSPWKSAIKVEDYQLVPVVKALQMHRVRLLLADGVGLGKTIQAGLIATELIHQRRIRKILIICPASLQHQWQEEMYEKFNLKFVILDSNEVVRIQRQIGIDTNPWSAIPKIITSMDYLRQIDVSNKFEISAQQRITKTKRVWDLLIVDEAHNFAPNSYTRESKRTQMLRKISKWFEHRLFLTATPHNGYTLSYTGLLELLDPIKFHRTPIIEERMKTDIKDVVIRRLKSDFIDEHGISYFPKRHVDAINVELKDQEIKLFNLINQYKQKIVERSDDDKEKRVHIFIFTLLAKRLLSSTYAFAKTWWVHLQSSKETGKGGEIKYTQMSLSDVSYDEADIAIKRSEETDLLDEQRENLESTAISIATTAFQLTKGTISEIEDIRKNITSKLNKMDLGEEILEQKFEDRISTIEDTKINSIRAWIDEKLMHRGKLKNDERVIIFTEYKDTQTYIQKVLDEKFNLIFPEVQILHGSTNRTTRNLLKQEFNDKSSKIRVLVATDTASEGLNLQHACRYIIHYDIPWNPSKLEQRNGRVDRHGQAKEVHIYHFNSENSADMKLLSKVASKVNTIQDDLGQVGEILAQVVRRHFSDHSIYNWEIDDIENVDLTETSDLEGKQKMIKLAKDYYNQSISEIGISPNQIASLFTTIFENAGGRIETSSDTTLSIREIPSTWQKLVDNSLRQKDGKLSGQIPKLIFSGEELLEEEGGRRVFRNQPGKHFVTIGHPIMQRALTSVKRLLWESQFQDQSISKWIISENNSSEENYLEMNVLLNIRNELGETLHSDYLYYGFSFDEENFSPLVDKSLLPEFYSIPINEQQKYLAFCRKIWMKYKERITEFLKVKKDEEVKKITDLLPKRLEYEIFNEKEKYEQSKEELESRKTEKGIAKLKKQLQKMELDYLQLSLDPTVQAMRDQELQQFREKVEEEEWRVRNESYLNSILEMIAEDHNQLVKEILPKRYSAKDSIEFHPIGVIFHLNGRKLEE